jgi:hypothetical protein
MYTNAAIVWAFKGHYVSPRAQPLVLRFATFASLLAGGSGAPSDAMGSTERCGKVTPRPLHSKNAVALPVVEPRSLRCATRSGYAHASSIPTCSAMQYESIAEIMHPRSLPA